MERVEADLGGTDIAPPLRDIIQKGEGLGLKKRVICFTDGAVSSPDAVTKLCKEESIVVHTIGIGNGCDKNMLEKMAKEGRGSCSLIQDDEG